MKIINTSDQNIEGFIFGNEKCDFPVGDINVVPDDVGKEALKQYPFLEEVKEKKEKAVKVEKESKKKKK